MICRASVRLITAVLVLSIVLPSMASAGVEVRLVGSEIPSRYFIGSNLIFHESDSLHLNGSLLERGVDYSFDSRRGAFDLNGLNAGENDTLRIVYSAVPSWMKTMYGTPLPDVSATPSAPRIEIPTTGRKRSGSSDINISGAKTFRFTTRSAGSSNFSQSLDLSLSGNLTPGLELTGSISDRGYDPSYGTANSRLNELDKINLKLASKAFTAQVGDIVLADYMSASGAGKRVSGASVSLRQGDGHFHAAVARPKGRFETVRLAGRDNTQGPYRVTPGTVTTPMVPGSETVWLDGVQLERGANNDYIVDYPAGTITFNVNHPIDARSRIEVDYEPLLTAYKGELIETGGGITLADSTVSVDVGWLREGDDKDEPFRGELSQEELDSLAVAGDGVEDAVRSGVIADTLGNYVIVADSLPDSVYQYVGDNNGDYSVTFNFFGQGQGDYVFIGGSEYRFVGEGNGEYLPLIVIPAAERIDYFQSRIRLRNVLLDELTAGVQQTKYDRNLFSDLDDDDNDGTFYSISAREKWTMADRENSVSFGARRIEAAFKTRQRLYDADFDRRYFLPLNFRPLRDETRYDFESALAPLSSLSVRPFYSRLDYDGSFESSTGGLRFMAGAPKKLQVTGGWSSIRAGLDTLGAERKGEADVVNAGVAYSVTSVIKVSTDYEYDTRRNAYSGEDRGTRYHRVRTSLGNRTEKLSYEFYYEDTLVSSWSEQVRRNRISASSIRRLGNLNYSALVTYQKLRLAESSEDDFLGRLSANYSDPIRQVGFGASYVISEETRNSRGVTYLEVEQGQGNYIEEDGEFVPDPDGNFIRVEETLSESSRVRRGEKSFYFNKTWPMALLRLNSNLTEELLPEGSRELWWVVPVLSDIDQPYLFYSRQYNGDLRLFPIKSGYFVNLDYSENREIRSVAGTPQRRSDFAGAVVFKQVYRKAFFEQELRLFRYDRDAYFSGAGVIDGYLVAAKYRQAISANEVSTRLAYRRAESETGERSQLYSVELDSRTQVLRRGELRTSVELYHQTFDSLTGSPSYLLTDNRPGTDGALWSVALRYGVKGDMRINVSVSGRHSDNREARITGRGEFVAGF